VGDHESPEMRVNSSCRDSRRRIRRWPRTKYFVLQVSWDHGLACV
jgi:hypothetical protein